MLLGKPHAASDIYSPLFGPMMGFKTNAYNTINPPTEIDAHRFGEKVYLHTLCPCRNFPNLNRL
jgi:hypothetical protein